MKALKQFVDSRNKFNSVFGIAPLVIGKDNQKIADIIDSSLSPENLTCDGELPRGQVQARYRELITVARELKALDPTVKMYEVA